MAIPSHDLSAAAGSSLARIFGSHARPGRLHLRRINGYECRAVFFPKARIDAGNEDFQPFFHARVLDVAALSVVVKRYQFARLSGESSVEVHAQVVACAIIEEG